MERATPNTLASRNIKAARGGRRKPMQALPGAQQSMPSAFGGGAAASQQGGLFGGSVQAPSSFEFAAPGISFPAPSFNVDFPPVGTEKNIFGGFANNISNNDSEAGVGGDEDRRKKSFREPPSSTAPSTFGQNQQTSFGSTNGQFPSLFTSSQPQPQASLPAFGAFTPAAAQDQSGSNMFFGGAPSQPAASGPSNLFGSTPAQPASSSFSFGQSKPQPSQQTSTFNFTAPTQDKPANNPFSFTQASTPASSISQPNPVNNLFANGQNATPALQVQPPKPLFGFSSSSTSNPPTPAPSNLFASLPQFTPSKPDIGNGPSTSSFGHSQPSSSAFSFGSTSMTAKPAASMVGTSQPTPSSQSAPLRNVFSGLSKAPTTSSMFEGQQESKTGETNSTEPNILFGSQSQQNPPSTNFFGTLGQSTANLSTSGARQSATTASTDTLTNGNKQIQSTGLFGTPKPASTSNLFGNSTTTPHNIFGGLPKPVQQSATPNNSAGAANATGNTANIVAKGTSSMLSAPPPTEAEKSGSSPFPFGAPATETKSNDSPFSFSAPVSAIGPQINGKSASSPIKSMEAPSSANQPPPTGMFPNLPRQISADSNGTIDKASISSALTSMTNTNSMALVNGNSAQDYGFLYDDMAAASSLSDEELNPLAPTSFSDDQKVEFFTAYRLRSLNKAMEEGFRVIKFNVAISKLLSFYNDKKVEILDRSSLPYPGSKRKAADDEDRENENRPKRSRPESADKSHGIQARPSPANSKRSTPLNDKDENHENKAPGNRSRQGTFPESNHLVSHTEFNSQGTPQTSIKGAAARASALASADKLLPAPSPVKGKRKAEVQLTKDDHEKEEQAGRRSKNATWLNSNGESGGAETSNTSNKFKSIVDTPSKIKKVAPLQGSWSPAPSAVNHNASKALNPFASLSVPKSPTKSASSGFTPSASLSKSPAKSAVSTDATNVERTPGAASTSKITNLFQPESSPDVSKKATSSALQTTVLQMPTFNNNGVDYMAEFVKSSKQASLEKAKEEGMDSDEDEKEFEAKHWKAEKAKEATFAKETQGKTGFVFGGSSNSAASSTSETPSQSAAAPLSFAQSGRSAGSSVFNSRASSPGGFGSSTGSIFDDPVFKQPQAISKDNFFAHVPPEVVLADDDSPNASDDENSENKDPSYMPERDPSSGSGSASGLGTPVEETGSGIASARRESGIPFTALSSTQSRGLGASNSMSGTSTLGGSLFGRITKAPIENQENTPSTPTAPAADTTTPARSLFDRITRAPIEPQENQENTPPATTTPTVNTNMFAHLNETPSAATVTPNMFAGLQKSSPAPPTTSSLFGSSNNTPQAANRTWTASDPIRFGTPTATTSDGADNPTVSITEATPTAPRFSNLFPATSQPLAPGSGLFGSVLASGATTPGSVNFNFGGQPSGTSSLFPSAIASATTSRATSPGNTTDGASDADDLEEKQEQLDLTSGDAGTEGEEKLHEVRAKATKFVPQDGKVASSWKSMGVGPLRLYKHKETGAARLILRIDPSGVIVLNKSLLAKLDYKADKKTVKLMAASDDGSGMETWVLQVKTAEMAEELAALMQLNKPSE